MTEAKTGAAPATATEPVLGKPPPLSPVTLRAAGGPGGEYMALLTRNDDGSCDARVPDLVGVDASGRDRESVLAAITGAVRARVSEIRVAGLAPPEPRTGAATIALRIPGRLPWPIAPEQLQAALEDSRRSGDRLGNSLVKLGVLMEEDLTQFLSKQYGVPAINLAEFDIDADVIALVPAETARKHRVVPVNRSGASLIVAMSDPSNVFAIDDLKFLTGLKIEVVVSPDAAIEAALAKYYRPTGPLESARRILVESRSILNRLQLDEDKVVVFDAKNDEAGKVRAPEDLLFGVLRSGRGVVRIEPGEGGDLAAGLLRIARLDLPAVGEVVTGTIALEKGEKRSTIFVTFQGTDKGMRVIVTLVGPTP